MTPRTTTIAIFVIWLCASASPAREKPIAPDLPAIIARLQSTDVKARDAAEEQLMRRARAGLDSDDGIELLRKAAALPPTNAKPTDHHDAAAVLIRAAAVRPVELYIPALRQMFPQLDPPARFEALELLVRVHSVTAARLYVQLVQEHAKALPELPIETLRAEPEFDEIYFPALIAVAGEAPQLGESVYILTLEYAEAGKIDPASLATSAQTIIAAYMRRHQRLVALQQPGGVKWKWAAAYQSDREPAGVLLDLMGHLPAVPVTPSLKQALTLNDPKLKLYAAVSLIKLAQIVPYKDLDLIASDDETRAPMFDQLRRLNRLDLFPEKYRTQEALAKSVMVQWLIYPTELERAPDQIELMTVLPAADPERGDYFVFRFRADDVPDKAGWMSAIAGPFKRGDPTVKDGGDTFSNFDKWETGSPQDHLTKILAGAKETREKQKAQEGAPIQHVQPQ